MVDSKSHDSDELVAVLINSMETLTSRLDRLEDQIKKQNEISAKLAEGMTTVNTTIKSTNEVFDQVSTGVKELYEKVKTLEVVGKLMSNLQNLGPLLGGLGGQPNKP